MSEVVIVFDNNPDGVFWAGQVVQGSFLLRLTEQVELKGVRAVFKGKAKTEWSSGSGSDKKTYSETEKYFKEKVHLYGTPPEETAETISFPPGEHFFPFRFQLPTDIPASFEGAHGKVEYSVQAIAEKPGWSFDITEKRTFTVHRHLDLNGIPDAMIELRESDSKTLGCCCCETGPLSATLRLPRKGCVVGGSVQVFGNIQNNTDRLILKCYVALSMHVTFRAKSHTNTSDKELLRLQGPSIQPGDSHQFNGDTFTVPTDIPASLLPACSIIDIDYFVSLVAVPSGPSFKLKVPIRVVVGTIPHHHTQEMMSGGGGFVMGGFAAAFANDPRTAPIATAPPPSAFPPSSAYPTAPPMTSVVSGPPEAPPPSYDSVVNCPPADFEMANKDCKDSQI